MVDCNSLARQGHQNSLVQQTSIEVEHKKPLEQTLNVVKIILLKTMAMSYIFLTPLSAPRHTTMLLAKKGSLLEEIGSQCRRGLSSRGAGFLAFIVHS